ncbi:MAG: hypothetical protein IRZ24_18500, partial [Thermogemmatispora sp.]
MEPPVDTRPSIPAGAGNASLRKRRDLFLLALLFLYCFAVLLSVIDSAIVSDVSSYGPVESPGPLGIIGVLMMIVLLLTLMISEGRRLFSLEGRLTWKRLRWWQKLLVVLGYLSSLIVPIYLILALRSHLGNQRQSLRQMLQAQWQSHQQGAGHSQMALVLGCSTLVITCSLCTTMLAFSEHQALLSSLTPTPVLRAAANSAAQAAHPATSPIVYRTQTVQATRSPVRPTATPTRVPTPTPTPRPRPTPTPPPPRPTPTPTPCPGAVSYSHNRPPETHAKL